MDKDEETDKLEDSRATILLQRSPVARRREVEPERVTAALARPRPRLLLVAKESAVRDLVATELSGGGYDILCTARGDEPPVAGTPVDVVLLDVTTLGRDALERWRMATHSANAASPPVIALVTRDRAAACTEEIIAVGDDFCVLPTARGELDLRIRLLLSIKLRERSMLEQSSAFRVAASTDALTELGNRRAFNACSEAAWATVASGRRFAILLLDIDRFKVFNDRFGHQTGDAVLKTVARTMQASVREGDQVFRFGGEEFVALAPDATEIGAIRIGERIRRAMAVQNFAPCLGSIAGTLRISVSLGLVVAPCPGLTTLAQHIEAADKALYDAKAGGRNRVVSMAAAAARNA